MKFHWLHTPAIPQNRQSSLHRRAVAAFLTGHRLLVHLSLTADHPTLQVTSFMSGAKVAKMVCRDQ
ncbi:MULTISPECIES: hypothetical protein [Providencia]|uniref:hypothetical protein n=1 Tax=Providencia TaxID=586 RepID=UPI0024804807|nr:hypothetical protein [Providencia rettgeri]MDU7495923.1 hypothetical protein [Providencia rettgeri]